MKLFFAFRGRRFTAAGAVLAGAVWLTGCRTTPPLPPADFSQPGWQVQRGQAIWQPPQRKPELAGEILVARRAGGDAFIQFTKDPFPLATAQTAGDRWQIDFGAGRRSWHGRGQPPKLFLWLQLPRALRGDAPDSPWRFSRTNETWRLENPRSGEWLEGRFFE